MFQGVDGANICNKCIENGYRILVDNDMVAAAGRKGRSKAAPLRKEELLKPAEIKEFLDQYVIGQDAAKRYLSVAVYNHYKRLLYAPKEDEVELDKSNIVLVRAHGYGQDPDGPHDRQAAEGPLHDRGRHGAHRGRVRGRGCREHPLAAAAGGRLRRRAGPARHRLHRRDRQDRPQGGQPVDHARRLGRGCAAGAAEDPRRVRW